jgi:cytochrome b561
VVIQAVGGYLHHRMYTQSGKKSSIAPVHKIAGLLILVVGLINGGL